MIDKSIHKSSLLVVEDEIHAGEALKEMLELYGYRVCLESSGLAAVSKVSSAGKGISAILMDISMPGAIDGIEAVHEIQQEYPQIPVIMVTAHANDDAYRRRVREAELRIAGWIDKPITGENEVKLLQLVEKKLRSKSD